MNNLQKVISTANVEEIKKELAVLASIDTDLLGRYALRARKDRMMLLAFKLAEASQQMIMEQTIAVFLGMSVVAVIVAWLLSRQPPSRK